ncbi:T9SS type B sorting domain-containing protein [Salinimicrobium flavum]|uniref:T9SS type B sorting domain-containing protein n=1 Tax=Salinimicrobium flavum TaxID=1737065 RepID=A0ABW5IYA8_9FLAO
MRTLLILWILLLSTAVRAQLGFCEGSKGDPIFEETFGSGYGTGSPLPAGVTSYGFVTEDPYDGQYTISDNIGGGIDTWHSWLPNTTVSGGRALIVNASYTSGQFYSKEISGLCQNTSYEFSAFILNVYDRDSGYCPNGGIPVNVRFEIWDVTDSVLLKEGSTGDIPSTGTPEWEQYGLTFRSQAGQDSIILKMFNNGDGGCGNDLAIDDITFRSCGDLTTVTGEGTAASGVTVCEEESPVSVKLTATPDLSVYNSHYFQWQQSSDNENWQDLPGETNDTYQTPALTSSAFFRVKVAEDAANLSGNLCNSASEAYHVKIIKTPEAPFNPGDKEVCGTESFPALGVEVEDDETVNWYDAAAGGTLLAENSLTYTPSSEGTFYAEAVKINSGCNPGPRTAVSLHVFPLPEISDEVVILCEASLVELDAGLTAHDYSWSTGETTRQITVGSPGIYEVLITNSFGCSVVKIIEVAAAEVPEITTIVSEEKKVTVLLAQEGHFEYSLDGSNFQTSNVFPSVEGGIYTAMVRDTGGCQTVVREFAHIVIPRYFTPNSDGYNDNFEVKGLSFFGASHINIFDRYGRLLRSGAGEDFRWDGTFAGKDLPADDYWFEISIDGFESKRGHFSLLR